MTKFTSYLLLLMAAWESIAATYVLEGVNYQVITGPNYTENMGINGFIEFAEELEPNSTINTDNIIDYRFNDGIQVLQQSNSLLSIQNFSTNEDGLPFLYRIQLVKTPTTNVIGEQLSGMILEFTYNTEGFERFEGGYSGPCEETGSSICEFADIFIDSGLYISPGLGGAPLPNWSLISGTPQQVPLNNALAMFFMMILILLVALFSHKIQSFHK